MNGIGLGRLRNVLEELSLWKPRSVQTVGFTISMANACAVRLFGK